MSKAARGEKAEDGDAEEDEEGSEPDLSWLPDPDLLYGKDGKEGSLKDEEDAVEGAVEEVVVKEGKRKKTIIKKIIPKKKAKLDEEDGAKFDTGLSLGDDEDLAMQLLRR